MPYENEHSCRLREAADFEADSFFREPRTTEEGKNYDEIMGNLISDGSVALLSCRYPTSEWTEAEARARCKENGGIAFEAAIGAEEMDKETPPEESVEDDTPANAEEEPLPDEEPPPEDDPKAGMDEEDGSKSKKDY